MEEELVRLPNTLLTGAATPVFRCRAQRGGCPYDTGRGRRKGRSAARARAELLPGEDRSARVGELLGFGPRLIEDLNDPVNPEGRFAAALGDPEEWLPALSEARGGEIPVGLNGLRSALSVARVFQER